MIEFYISVNPLNAENISNQLSLLDAAAVTVYDEDPQETLLVALFENDSVAPAITYFLQQQSGQVVFNFHHQIVDQQEWVRVSLDQFKPMQFGERLWICPTWEKPVNAEAINIILDPGLAFGTGTHPTTALCLEWIDANIHGGERVIDFGCGSGLLAIAAIKLGAKHALAIDNDPNAIIACKENAEKNGTLSAMDIAALENLPENFKADIIFANILFQPLKELVETFANLLTPGGRIILSGILEDQIPDIKDIYQNWFNLVKTAIREDWVLMEWKLSKKMIDDV